MKKLISLVLVMLMVLPLIVGCTLTPATETDAPETEAPETEAPETDVLEINSPEIDAPETEAPETAAPETDAPETEAPETAAPETDEPETEKKQKPRMPNWLRAALTKLHGGYYPDESETDEPETDEPETDEPETDEPETDEPETEAPETEAPETEAPETEAPETEAPETEAPETEAPETEAPETEAPETEAPETEAPETEAPETEAPETEAPETEAPETEAPETEAPETEAPETEAPETEAPETEAPETGAPETEAPETEAPETEAPETEEPEPEVEYVYYSDFGAAGDGVTDDFEAIVAAHDYANEHNLPVAADEGATYYIGEASGTAIIRTNTTWTGATFIVDDTSLIPWQSSINTLFLVDGDEYVSGFDIDSLEKGQKHLGFAPGEDLLVTVENDNVMMYKRKFQHANDGIPMSDTFIVDAEGNILSDIVWDFDTITSCKAKRIGDPLVIDGGTFLFKVNRHDSESYFARNIKIIRSNTTVQNLTMKIIDEVDASSPYSGFITIIETAHITLKNVTLDAYKTTKTQIGTYALQINYSADVTLDNVVQGNDILDQGRWGIMNTNFCKDFVVKNSRLNRYDSHMGVTNCTIENSTIGANGVNLVGHGTFILKDSTVYNDCLIILRADYGATWDGDIYIENVDWYHSSSCPSVLYARNNSDHDFGYTCYQPHNIYIDGLDIYEYNAPAGENYPRILCYYVRDEEIGTLSPYVLTERVVVNNLNTANGLPTYISFNEGDYPDTEWVITNSNVIKECLPRLD